jgi:hypothetical protein
MPNVQDNPGYQEVDLDERMQELQRKRTVARLAQMQEHRDAEPITVTRTQDDIRTQSTGGVINEIRKKAFAWCQYDNCARGHRPGQQMFNSWEQGWNVSGVPWTKTTCSRTCADELAVTYQLMNPKEMP